MEDATKPVRPREFRKRYLIYPRFQLALIGANVLVLLGCFAMAGLAISRSYSFLVSEGIALGLPESHAYYKFLGLPANILYQYLGVALVAPIALSSVAALLISSKLAGPIVRLKSYFGGLGVDKQRSPLKFRKSDFFDDLPEVINTALDRLPK
jgi:hypothetical protein